jgi:hypothetical protein
VASWFIVIVWPPAGSFVDKVTDVQVSVSSKNVMLGMDALMRQGDTRNAEWMPNHHIISSVNHEAVADVCSTSLTHAVSEKGGGF